MSLRGKHFNVIKLGITFNDIITMKSSPIDLQRTNDHDRGSGSLQSTTISSN